MANTIDGIVKCDISIESPAVSEESMSGLLILVGEKADDDGRGRAACRKGTRPSGNAVL